MKNAKVLGLVSDGGHQIPVFAALGARCTVLYFSKRQLQSEKEVSEREKYEIKWVKVDMTMLLPFENESFDLIFHPVSNSYIEDILPIRKNGTGY